VKKRTISYKRLPTSTKEEEATSDEITAKQSWIKLFIILAIAEFVFGLIM